MPSQKINLKIKSRERVIEMMVDSICNFNLGISVQFWKDVRLYGIRPAINALRGYCPNSNFEKLENYITKIEGDLDQC